MQTIDHTDVSNQVTIILLKKIIELLSIKEEPAQTIQADEVRAALRNELSAVVKSINAIPDNKDILKELKVLQAAIKAIEVSPQVNVAAAQVTVPEIKIPLITIPEINIPEINVPTPQVNYTAPEIVIPAPIVNVAAPVVMVEPTDISSVIRSLELNLNKLRTNSETRPLAVRLSDGQRWVKELQELNKTSAQTVQYMSDVSYIKNNTGGRINPATEETVTAIAGLVTEPYNYISLSPASLPTTIVYKRGGASGTTVATLTLTYSGTDVETVTRS